MGETNTHTFLFVCASEDQTEDFLALFDSSTDGRRKLASLSKASSDRTTWNILVPHTALNNLQLSYCPELYLFEFRTITKLHRLNMGFCFCEVTLVKHLTASSVISCDVSEVSIVLSHSGGNNVCVIPSTRTTSREPSLSPPPSPPAPAVPAA